MGVHVPIGFAQGVFVFSVTGTEKRSAVTMGFDMEGDTTALDAAAHAIFDQLTATSRPFAAGSTNAFYTFEGVQLLAETATGPMIGSWMVPVVGLGANALPPPNVAILVKKNTARGGRKGRGRMFLPPLVIGEQFVGNAGDVTPANVTQLQNTWNGFLGATASMAQHPVLLHSNPADSPDLITSFTVTPLVATQRRRLR